MLPRTLPSTTTSRAEIFAATFPFRPIVTRLPGSMIDPSTRPSIYSDSDPDTSPLITSDFPIVAWSEGDVAVCPLVTGRLGLASNVLLLVAGRAGSGVTDAFVPAGWFGFHIASISFPHQDWRCRR
jgi:hypothetical protein